MTDPAAPSAHRPRRSVLYMPGSNRRALAKGRTLAADALIFDLEDAVAPNAKTGARANVLAALADGGYGHREVIVRVNGPDTPWGADDVAALAQSGADALLLAKVNDAETVTAAAHALAAAGAPESLGLMAMIETPQGVLHAEAIANANPRLMALVMGTADLAQDLHAAHTPDDPPLLTARSLCLLAARAAGLAALDGVHLELDDDDGFARALRQARAMGFDGKTLIHPKTIDAANAAFSPTDDEIAAAHAVIAAHAEAVKNGAGVTVLDGKLVEALHVKEAERTVAFAETIGGRGRDAGDD